MAIIIDGNKKKTDVAYLTMIAGVFLTIGAIAYYVFFGEAPLIENIPSPEGYETLSKISKLKIDAEGITSSPIWQSLINQPEMAPVDLTITTSRINPFELTDGTKKISR